MNMKERLLPFDLALQRKSMQKASQLLSGNVNISGLQGYLPGQQSLQAWLHLMSAFHEKVWGQQVTSVMLGAKGLQWSHPGPPYRRCHPCPFHWRQPTPGNKPGEAQERNADAFFSSMDAYSIERDPNWHFSHNTVWLLYSSSNFSVYFALNTPNYMYIYCSSSFGSAVYRLLRYLCRSQYPQ